MPRPEATTVLGMGGSGLGNHRVRLDEAAADALLTEAWDCGVRLFDTAPHYGLGLSERRLGTFLASRPREEFRVSTKVGRLLVPRDNPDGALDDEGFLVPADHRRQWDFSADGIRASLESSLDRLGLDRLDVAYLHDPERWNLDEALATGLPALAALREEGLVDTIGVGSMRLDALVAAARTGLVDELMVAGRLTLIDRESETELLPVCAAADIDVVAAAVFHGNLLCTEPTSASTYDYAAASPEILTRARRMWDLCAEAGVPLAAAALQFGARHAEVSTTVVGTVAPGQMRDDVALAAVEIPEDLWTALDEVAA